MTDIAELGFRIDSEPAAQAAQNLDKLEAASRRVESGTQKMQREIERTAAQFTQQSDRIRDMVRASIAAKEANGGIELSQRALAERSSMTAKRVAELNAALLARANTQEAVNARLKAFEDAEARVARAAAATQTEIKKEGDSITSLLGKIDPVVRKLGDLDKMEQQLRSARKAGQIGADDYTVYTQKIARMRDTVVAAGEGMHSFSRASAAASREIGMLIGQIARGDFSALQGSLVTLATRTGLLTGAFGAAVIGIGAVVAAVGGLGAAFVAGYREQQNYERIVIATGGAAGVTGGQIADMAEKIGAATGHYGDASTALSKLAQGGKLTGDQLEIAGRGAVALATLTAESVDKAADEYLKLADKPTDAVLKLNEEFHFLTASVFEHIQSLERQGQTQEAATIAMTAFADESARRASAVVDNAGSIEKAWKAVRDAVAGAWQSMKDIGKSDVQSQLMSAYADQFDLDQWRKTLDNKPWYYVDDGTSEARWKAEHDANQRRIQDLQTQIGLNAELAMGEQNLRTIEDEGVKAVAEQSKALDQHADKQAKLAKAIEETRRQYEAIRASGVAEINGMSIDEAEVERIQQLNKEFKDTEAIRARKEAQRDLRQLAEDELAISQFLDRLSGQVGGPYQKAWADYASALDQADKMAIKFKSDGMDAAKVQDFIAGATKRATENLVAQTDATSALDGVIASANSELERHTELYGLSNDELKVQEAYNRLLTAAERELLAVMGPLTEAEQKRLDALKGIAKQIVATDKASEDYRRNQEEIARGWVSIWESAGDSISRTFSDVIVNGGSLMKGLVDVAKNTVAAIIDYFSRLAIINPILNRLFGRSMTAGGMSMLPTLASAGGLLGGGGAAVTSTGLLNFTSDAAGGTSNSLFNSGSWISAGKNLWTGFQNGFSARGVAGSNWFGTYTPDAGTGTFAPSALGYGTAIAGGLYAGVSRYQDRYNTASGLAGGAAYGVGTAYATIGASAALSGGLAAGFGAIPVVGWVAIAAMLIDKLSGGSLFGTDANKFQRGESNLTVGPDGGVISIGADYKGRKPLFGGSYHEWKNIAPTQEQIDAANGFYKAILDQSTSFAKQFGQNVGEVATGTFRQIFDKKGNVTGSLSIVNGVEYQGEDQQAFAQRILAESMILDLKKIGVDISDYTQQFIKDAEAYAQAVQDSGLAIQYANQDLKNGIDISGGKGLQGAFDTTLQYQDGSDSIVQTYQRLSQEAQDLHDGIKLLTGQDTIESIEAFIRESQKVGETLAQTYVRLQQATAAYNSFVGQFAPQAEYVDDFEAALSGVYAQMKANIDQANALAKAAGLEGASVKDLANIHAAAAKQFAALLTQLKDSARSLAYQMGLIGPYNLDQVNSEIADLEGRANAGASAVQDFGRTITDVANRANNALQLLLGDLSPLNDQEKLQKALEGLRAGSVSQEEVLQIGRRLYASSEAYNRLFRQVQQFTPNPSAVGGGSYSSGANAGARGGLTEKERQRLEQLYKQQAGLLAAQDYANAQTLARQIAEISAASGDDLDAILKEWGLNADDLAKRLHLENATQLDEYIEGQKKLVDSNGQNTTILADLLRQIRDLLSHGGTDFRSPGGGRNYQVGEMALDEPRSESELGRLNRNLDRIIVPPSRNRRAPGVPYQ